MNIAPRLSIQRRGIALMLVMIAILVTGGMAVAYFGSRDNSVAISANITSASNARTVAESGLDLAVAILETDAPWRTTHVDGIILQDYPVGAGTISITITDSETGMPPTLSTLEVNIVVESTVDGRTQITEANAVIFPNDDEFDVDYSEFAMFASQRISVLGASSVQNWSASPMSSSEPVQIGTLARNPMAVQFDRLNRSDPLSLHTAKDASSMITSSSLSTNEFTDYLPFLSPPPPPIHANQLSISSNEHEEDSLSLWVSQFTSDSSNSPFGDSHTLSIDEGSYIVNELYISSGTRVEIHGDVVINVEDELTMEHANIILAEDATLTLHLGGDVEINSSYIGNEKRTAQSWMDPSRIQLFGQSDDEWTITGTSMLKAELYAPSSDIELSGISTICGRIAAENISMQGASRLLYDRSLDHGGFADHESPLYEEDGSLLNEVKQLTQLDEFALDSLQRAMTDSSFNNDEFSMRDYSPSNWRNEPTLRPNDVVYMLVVYGVDTRHWEETARELRLQNSNRWDNDHDEDEHDHWDDEYRTYDVGIIDF